MEGNIRRLESTLMLKTWKRIYYSLEDDKLCFYKDHEELEASELIDLSRVTSVQHKTYKCVSSLFSRFAPLANPTLLLVAFLLSFLCTLLPPLPVLCLLLPSLNNPF